MKMVEFGTQHREIVLLLHGGGLSWWNHRAAAEKLSDRYHVILPILDGHGGSDRDFISIEENAARLIAFIDESCGGSVLCIGGVSLGAQILVEMLSQRGDICRFTLIESASVLPDKLTAALVGPAFSACYGLIRRKWFAKLQARYLRIPDHLFEDYYRDTCAVSRENLVAFTRASAAYGVKESLAASAVKALICVGGKELGSMKKSARILREVLSGSALEIKEGLYHGEFSLGHADPYARELMKWIQ